MLPVETFTDVVSFLSYYDLAGLKLASKLCSAVANRCADSIRIFDFSDFAFYINDYWIDVYRLEWCNGYRSRVCQFEFTRENAMAEFISEAFRNGTIGRFYLQTRREHVAMAIKAVASTIVIAVKLELHVGLFEEWELFEFVDSFCRVKCLTIWQLHCVARDKQERIRNFCERKHITLRIF